MLGKVFAQDRKRLHCSRNKECVVQFSYCNALLHLSHSLIMEVKMDPVLGSMCPSSSPEKKGENLLETQDMFIPGAETLLPWQGVFAGKKEARNYCR